MAYRRFTFFQPGQFVVVDKDVYGPGHKVIMQKGSISRVIAAKRGIAPKGACGNDEVLLLEENPRWMFCSCHFRLAKRKDTQAALLDIYAALKPNP